MNCHDTGFAVRVLVGGGSTPPCQEAGRRGAGSHSKSTVGRWSTPPCQEAGRRGAGSQGTTSCCRCSPLGSPIPRHGPPASACSQAET
jgi:hypothetical protein